jgi:hypothetical protein
MNSPDLPPPLHPEPLPKRKSDTGLFAGLALIALGLLFLLVNVTDLRIRNWAAVLLLVPAVMLLAQVATHAVRDGGVYRSMRVSLSGGLVLLVLGCLALFHLSMARYWPVVLIAVGIGMTIARRPHPGEEPQ